MCVTVVGILSFTNTVFCDPKCREFLTNIVAQDWKYL